MEKQLCGQGTETLRNTVARDVQKSRLQTIPLEKFTSMAEPTIHASARQKASGTHSNVKKNLHFTLTVL